MDKRLRHLNNLRSFECAARHQSYGKAAVELCISQAAVSQQMRQLEISLGVKLFVRKGRSMILTQSGTQLFNATASAFEILLTEFNNIQNEEVAGSLTITTTPSFSALWLMPKLHQFTTKYPEIKIRVVSSINFENLAQNHIDLAIRFGTSVESSTQDGLICDYFGEDHVYPVCSAKLASENKLNSPQDILNHWLIKLEKPGPFSWDVWFENAGIKHYKQHNKWTEVMSTDLALSAVQNGHGFTLAAESLFKQAVANGNLVIPFLIKHPLSVKRYLVYDLNSSKQARLKIFMDWIKTEMNK